MPSTLTLSIIIAACVVAEIVAEHRDKRRAIYLLKPLTIVLAIVLAASISTPVSVLYQRAIVAGLICSLFGDVFLMLPRDRFVAGLGSFLCAHLCYIIAFSSVSMSLSIAAGAALLVYGVALLRILWPQLETLRAPVTLYAVVLLGMAWVAIGQWRARDTLPALCAAAGAGLFVISDSTLALERFTRRRRYGQALVLTTYFAAQWLIAMSGSDASTPVPPPVAR